ncbi:hypothetical protein ON010_g11190 [Phytophthora cinnamomi]|nr:hypothetical protein ON010_g11190 [Phytophthora cinnamomi]
MATSSRWLPWLSDITLVGELLVLVALVSIATEPPLAWLRMLDEEDAWLRNGCEGSRNAILRHPFRELSANLGDHLENTQKVRLAWKKSQSDRERVLAHGITSLRGDARVQRVNVLLLHVGVSDGLSVRHEERAHLFSVQDAEQHALLRLGHDRSSHGAAVHGADARVELVLLSNGADTALAGDQLLVAPAKPREQLPVVLGARVDAAHVRDEHHEVHHHLLREERGERVVVPRDLVLVDERRGAPRDDVVLVDDRDNAHVQQRAHRALQVGAHLRLSEVGVRRQHLRAGQVVLGEEHLVQALQAALAGGGARLLVELHVVVHLAAQVRLHGPREQVLAVQHHLADGHGAAGHEDDVVAAHVQRRDLLHDVADLPHGQQTLGRVHDLRADLDEDGARAPQVAAELAHLGSAGHGQGDDNEGVPIGE